MQKHQKANVPNKLAVAAAIAAMQIGAAWAQSTDATAPAPSATPTAASAPSTAPTAKGGTLNLDEVIVTASPTGRSKMKSSDSVSSVGEEAIARGGATSASEILRGIPGIRAESSGGEGNANVTVRGAPVSAGGSRYVQFQEDGLPVLLFGDVAFGTPDQFLRTDYTTDRVEVVRGGSASTMVSNAPGGVINFVSKNGKDVGNSVGVTMGLGSRLNRYDFNYGAGLGERTYFNIGGFVRQGEGGAHRTGFNSEDGSQIKGSLTHELDGGGFVRLNFKHLDDKTPSYMPVPVTVSNGKISTIAGIDPRKAFFINSSLSRDTTVDRDGNLVSTNPADGLHVSSSSFGLESKINLGDGWTLEEKFRKSANSGRFMALFPADNGSNGTSSTFTGTMFNTSLDNMDNMFNDLKMSKSFALNEGKAAVTGGVFTGSQNLAQTWFWNQYSIAMVGNGATINSTPTSSGWDTWGGCCARSYDVRYTTTAPYAAVSWDRGPVSLDASIRNTSLRATGQTIKGSSTSNTWDNSTLANVNYSMSKTAYSLGANYAVSGDTSVYTRISDGFNFSGDRILYGTALDGSAPIAFNELKQQEIGIKHRQGDLSLFGTFFMAKTDESNYEATTQKFTANSYDAKGVELEMGYRMGALRLNSGVTLTRAKITKSQTASEVGNTPKRQAKLVYSITPSYRVGQLEFGAAFVGSSKAYGDDANTITMPSYVITNLFASYQLSKDVVASFSMNNAFNKLAYTEVEGDGHAARALAGRSAKVSLKYNF